LLIPGTGDIAHLQQNIAAGDITLPAEAVGRLDAIGNLTGEGLPEGVAAFVERG
jgi:pyridoxine 4-dehydrogenase